MKVIGIVGVILVSFLSGRAQQITVRSFKSEDVDFRVYRTYFWAAHADQLDEGSYFRGDLIFKADIRESIHEEMEARGFTRSYNRPDLLINFRMFDGPVTIRGREGYGASYWQPEEISSIDLDVNEIKIGPGTLMISLLDANTRKLVWQGIATGFAKDEENVYNEGDVRKAIELIMNQYSFRANEYTKR